MGVRAPALERLQESFLSRFEPSRRATPALSQEDLRKRMALNSPPLVGELYQTALRELQAETARQARIDAKATSLLTSAGLSTTVAIALLIGSTRPPPPTALWWTTVYLVAVGAGLFAAIFALFALFVRGHPAPDERALFDQTELLKANQADEADTAGTSPHGLMLYRRAVTPHLWEVVQRQTVVLAGKAWLVKAGQTCFVAFLILLVVVCARVAAKIPSCP